MIRPFKKNYSTSSSQTIIQRFLLLVLTCILILACKNQDSQPQKSLQKIIHFATKVESEKLLLTEDEYTKQWSQTDLDRRLRKEGGTKKEQFNQVKNSVREWNEIDKQRILKQCSLIDTILNQFDYSLNFPDSIIFIHSSLEDELAFDSYTRRNCIIFKNILDRISDDALRFYIAHNLFHIVARYDQKFRKEMYSLIGFNLCNKIPYPKEFEHKRITNPDDFYMDSYITLNYKNSLDTLQCGVIMYVGNKITNQDFRQNIKVGLLKLKGSKNKEIDYQDGKPQIFSI